MRTTLRWSHAFSSKLRERMNKYINVLITSPRNVYQDKNENNVILHKGVSHLSRRKVVDANHRERWVSNNTYWELRKNPGFINMEPTANLW